VRQHVVVAAVVVDAVADIADDVVVVVAVM